MEIKIKMIQDIFPGKRTTHRYRNGRETKKICSNNKAHKVT
jgi:hypothetical protein